MFKEADIAENTLTTFGYADLWEFGINFNRSECKFPVFDMGSKAMVIIKEASIERNVCKNACERFHKEKTIDGSF